MSWIKAIVASLIMAAMAVMGGGVAVASPTTDTTIDRPSVTVNLGGTWDKQSQFVWPLTGALYKAPAGNSPTVNVPYFAGGFDLSDLLDGMTYDNSRKTGEVGVTAAIEQAANNGSKVDGKAFSQGADAIIEGARAAIVQGGVDPSMVSIQAMASPVQPVTGLRNRLPFDFPGISRGNGGDAGGAAVDWACVGRDLVCHAPSDLDPIKWANGVAEYWLVHSANGRGCTYEVLICDHQTYVRIEGNQTFTEVVAEAGLVQMADNANIALPDAVKNWVRDVVADGGPAYRPSAPEATPAPVSTTPVSLKTVITQDETLAPEPAIAPVIIPDPVQTAHATVNGLGLDAGMADALNGALTGVFGR